jgi:hypothetical protein
MAKLLLAALLLTGCSHAERAGNNAEDVPPPLSVQQNAIPNDMPPATTPIPKTASSAPQPASASEVGSVEVNPGPRRGRRAQPRPKPLPPGQPVQAPEPLLPGH